MGNVDVYHSRRTNYALCKYWVRNEKISDAQLNEYVLKTKPQGEFYAKEVNPNYNQENPQANAMMFQKNVITLETNDDINDIKVGNVVMYNGKLWHVEGIQSKLHRKESEFDTEEHYTIVLNIRR